MMTNKDDEGIINNWEVEHQQSNNIMNACKYGLMCYDIGKNNSPRCNYLPITLALLVTGLTGFRLLSAANALS